MTLEEPPHSPSLLSPDPRVPRGPHICHLKDVCPTTITAATSVTAPGLVGPTGRGLNERRPRSPLRECTGDMNADVGAEIEPVFDEDEVAAAAASDLHAMGEDMTRALQSAIATIEKPNILVVGITGCGKSTLVNAVFGYPIAKTGVGRPVTQFFSRYEPPNLPVVVYDSRGLENGAADRFIADTRAFIDEIQAKPNLEDHIHVVWYVVNAASGRFEDFEARLCCEVFRSIPVLFLLNKCDICSSEQVRNLEQLIRTQPKNIHGIARVVSERHAFVQDWCPACWCGNVTVRKATKEITCDDCPTTRVLTKTHGLEELVQNTTTLLPELAKDAFLYAQAASVLEKDNRAKTLVKECSKAVSFDVSGKVIHQAVQMYSRIFVLWGWSLMGRRLNEAIAEQLRREFRKVNVSFRLAMAAADRLFSHNFSRSILALGGIVCNRLLRDLFDQTIQSTKIHNESANRVEGTVAPVTPLELHEDFPIEAYIEASMQGVRFNSRGFLTHVMRHGIDSAVDTFWM